MSKKTPTKKVPSYKNKNMMPATVEERSNRYFELREENTDLKEKLKDYDSDLKKMATKLIKLQDLMDSNMKQIGSASQPAYEMDELATLAKENQRLKALAKIKEEELRNIHTVKAHCKKTKVVSRPGGKSKAKTNLKGIVCLNINE
jgi:hypothetical protein